MTSVEIVRLLTRAYPACEHVCCDACGMCAAYGTTGPPCPNAEDFANDRGRVTTDRHAEALHRECRRELDAGYG